MSIARLLDKRMIFKKIIFLYTGNNQIEMKKIITVAIKNKKHWWIRLMKDVQGLSTENYKILLRKIKV